MNWKKVGEKMLFPPAGLIFFFVILSAVALVGIFLKGLDTAVIAYVVYVFSFYTLSILCIWCWKKLPGYYRRIKNRVYDNPYANRYFTDAVFKNNVGLNLSFLINVLYVFVNAVSAVLYHTAWFAIFAIYYMILAVMRLLLARYTQKYGIGRNRPGELKRSRLCAWILLTVNLILSGVVLMMSYYDRGFEYQGVLIYVIAVYTFYITINAIVNLVKYRKYNSPVMSVTKVIKLAAALFSMLFLETAMFSQFGTETPESVKRIMIMSTGAGISVIVVAMAVYVIIHATKEIKAMSESS